MNKQYVKNQVKIQLWRMGHRARDLEGTPGVRYDLLVDDKFRLCVLDDAEAPSTRVLQERCDVVAALCDGRIMYLKPEWKNTGWKTPTEMFGPKEKKKGGEQHE